MSNAYEHEPDPIDNNNRPVWDVILEDIRSRREMGIKKYGMELRPFNGRDPLWDAYQESLDQVVYLRQAIIERDSWTPISSKVPDEGVLVQLDNYDVGYWIEMEYGDPDEHETYRPVYPQWYAYVDGEMRSIDPANYPKFWKPLLPRHEVI